MWSATNLVEESAAVTYVFDPASGEVTLLPSQNNLGLTTCGGSYIAWTEISADDVDDCTITLA